MDAQELCPRSLVETYESSTDIAVTLCFLNELTILNFLIPVFSYLFLRYAVTKSCQMSHTVGLIV